MKLYAMAGSNNVRKVQAVASHLGTEMKTVYLDLFEGDLKTPEFLAINPNGKVPVLVDGDFVLWESNAIMRYLCRMTPEQDLYPGFPVVASDIDRWLSWELSHYNKAFGNLVWETVAKPQFLGGEGVPSIIESNTAYLHQYAAVLDQHMTDREFAVGKHLTLADYALIHVEFFKEMIPFDWTPYPTLNAYYERMRLVPHWMNSAVPPEQLGRKPASS